MSGGQFFFAQKVDHLRLLAKSLVLIQLLTAPMNVFREVMIRNLQVSFVTNVKSDSKAGGTKMGRPYPAQYLGRGVSGSELNFKLYDLLFRIPYRCWWILSEKQKN